MGSGAILIGRQLESSFHLSTGEARFVGQAVHPRQGHGWMIYFPERATTTINLFWDVSSPPQVISTADLLLPSPDVGRRLQPAQVALWRSRRI